MARPVLSPELDEGSKEAASTIIISSISSEVLRYRWLHGEKLLEIKFLLIELINEGIEEEWEYVNKSLDPFTILN